MKKIVFCFCSFFMVCFLFLACNVSENKTSKVPHAPKHVIVVGFDGLSAYCITHGADMPTYRKLMNEGAYTVENRSVLPSSSAANWASMFMGASPELHGYTTWGSQTPDLPPRVVNEHGMFPDIFNCVRKLNPEAELGFLFEWNGMRYLVDTLSLDYMKQVSLSGDNIEESVAPAVNYIKEKKPTLCGVIFDQPDGTGHGKGWESEEYYAMVNHLDKALSKIVKAVEEAGMIDETVFVLTSDHGGIETGHGGKTMKEMQTTIVFSGKGIKHGFQITESTMVYDIAATIGYMFGIEQPQVWIGRPVYSIFE